MSIAVESAVRHVRVRVEGTVQGVGFRPYVYRLAGELGCHGHVFNDTRGLVVDVEAEPAAIERFLGRLAPEAPPLAAVERVSWRELPPAGARGFEIRASPGAGVPNAPVSPDSSTCEACLAELADPGDRRYRYPFINCTDCGPRFTIVRGVPYDRPLTTMTGFTMCGDCRREYDDPADRRFHAQPNACPLCGPRALLIDAEGGELPLEGALDAVQAAAGELAAGAIVAVKGLGGYHLACRADHEPAVASLRARKHREDKPFALMVPDIAAARRLVELADEEERLLLSRERPIVLAPRRTGAAVAGAVAPRASELGLMLPYSPLHHLLLGDTGLPLVMTSGNVSDEPIAFGDADALARLAAIADCFLVHDRPIETRTDDSVLRVVAAAGERRPSMLRRSRGYVPASLTLPLSAPRPVLACGAELKSTFCVAKADRAWVSHHVGDLHNFETLESFRHGIEHFQRLFAVAPEVVAHDLHPDYLSTAHAFELDGVRLVGVQHHHAHLAACLAEHGHTGPAVGAIFDGTGSGTDGTIWGGELLLGDLGGCERVGHLWPVRLPGGDRATRQPWRMACAWLVETAADRGREPELPPALVRTVEPAQWRAVARMAQTGLSAPLTTSAGRLFDAVSALCGLCACANYEGQAAIELEAAADPDERRVYPMPLLERGGALVLDARETVAGVVGDLVRGVDAARVSGRFHNALARATADACTRMAAAAALDTVVLSGGVFCNRLLLERTAALLADAGLRVLYPRRLPPNDGGISYGQAAVAAFRDRSGAVAGA